MNDDPRHDGTDVLPDALRWQLRAMRRDEVPANDLWPAIARQLPPRESGAAPAPQARGPWLAIAASMLLVVGLAGALRPQVAADPAEAAALREADRLARHYGDALESMPVVPRTRAVESALAELDRSARDIRRALSMDPDSRLLLDQLQRTYARRLALAQRAIHG